MPRLYCVLCKKIIETSSAKYKKRSIFAPYFYPSFKIYIGEDNVDLYKESDALCNGCHIKVSYYLTYLCEII